MLAHTASTGQAVAFIDTPRPAMMLVRVAGRGRRGDVTHRREFGRGVVLGDHHHQRGQHQADNRRAEQLHRAQFRVLHADVAQQQPGHGMKRDRGDHAGYDHAFVERDHDLLRRAAALTKKQPMIEAMIETPPSASG